MMAFQVIYMWVDTMKIYIFISFLQVRSRAVQTLNHSLSSANRTTPFQLKELVDILAFESDSEVQFDFCHCAIV